MKETIFQIDLEVVSLMCHRFLERVSVSSNNFRRSTSNQEQASVSIQSNDVLEGPIPILFDWYADAEWN